MQTTRVVFEFFAVGVIFLLVLFYFTSVLFPSQFDMIIKFISDKNDPYNSAWFRGLISILLVVVHIP